MTPTRRAVAGSALIVLAYVGLALAWFGVPLW